MAIFPTAVATSTTLPNARSTGDSGPATDHNAVASEVIAIEAALGANASNVYLKGSAGVTVADGGTGGTTAATARTSLGLGSLATLSSIDLTANVGSTVLPIANGGTGTTTGRAAERIVTASNSTSATPNSSTTDTYRLTLTGNVTLNVPSGTPVDAQRLSVECFQDSTGSRTITLASGYYVPSTLAAPTLGTTASSLNVLAFKYNGALSKWVYYGIV